MAEDNQGRKAIFRVPAIALLGVALLMVCLAPTAFAGVPGLWVLYLIPLGLIIFVVRTRTVATAKGLTVRTMFGRRELPWESLKGLAITDRAKVRAVLTDGTEVPLPTVRTRHLPVMSLVSEGRFKDPTGLTDDLLAKSRRGQADASTADARAESTAESTGEGSTEDTAEDTGGTAEHTDNSTPDAASDNSGADKQ